MVVAAFGDADAAHFLSITPRRSLLAPTVVSDPNKNLDVVEMLGKGAYGVVFKV